MSADSDHAESAISDKESLETATGVDEGDLSLSSGATTVKISNVDRTKSVNMDDTDIVRAKADLRSLLQSASRRKRRRMQRVLRQYANVDTTTPRATSITDIQRLMASRTNLTSDAIGNILDYVETHPDWNTPRLISWFRAVSGRSSRAAQVLVGRRPSVSSLSESRARSQAPAGAPLIEDVVVQDDVGEEEGEGEEVTEREEKTEIVAASAAAIPSGDSTTSRPSRVSQWVRRASRRRDTGAGDDDSTDATRPSSTSNTAVTGKPSSASSS